MREKVDILDTTLRDGEQSPGCGMNVANKLLVAKQLARLGVDIIEAGFPISSPGDFEAVSRIAQAIRGPRICALARTRKADIEAVVKALKKAERPRIHVFVATSDVHRTKKLRKSPEEILVMVDEHVRLAKSCIDDVQFSPEDATRTGIDFLKQVISVAIDAGANIINLPDTVGYSVGVEFPHMVGMVKKFLKRKNSHAVISVHCHNDLDLAVANTLAGIQAGARQFEGCILGIGERAGNAQLEAVVMALKTRCDFFGVQLGVHTKRLYETAHVVSSAIGKPIPDNLPIVGGNAFSHGAGIHQQGMLEDRRTYEIMKPQNVGWHGEATPLTNRSGHAGLENRLCALGYKMKSKTIDAIYPRFKSLADQKTYVYNDDLHLLMQEFFVEQMPESDKLIRYERVDYHRVKNALSATITMSQNDSLFEASGTGDGAVASVGDAIMKALEREKILPKDSVRVKEFNISKGTGGIEAVGLVNLVLENDRGIGYGRGSDTDVIVAFAKAMVAGINHLLQTPVQENNGI